MLRILFALLSLVSLGLAIVLKQPLLYAAAGVLLFVTLLLVVVHMRRRHKKEAEVFAHAHGAMTPEDELASLGIMEIRPRGGPAKPPVEEAEEAAPQGAAAPADNGADPAWTERVRKIDRQALADRDPTAERVRKEVWTPFLEAVRAALGANTVALLSTEDEAARKFQIEAAVSKNAYARTQGRFSVQETLWERRRSTAVQLRRVGGDGGLPSKHLGYYVEPIAARQVALAGVEHPGETRAFVLLADTMEDGGLGTARQQALLAQFAALLASVLDTREPEAVEEAPPEARPRRDIIAEEMEKARARQAVLALALVHLNHAEEVSAGGEEAVLEAEQRLEARLRAAAAQARVERFGELTYGLFYAGSILDVEAWAEQLQQDLAEEGGVLEGGVSIGVAMLDDRHEGPDDFRDDATKALRLAYESGVCTIVE